MEHEIAAIADQRIYFPFRFGDLNPQGTCDLVAHRGEAIFHVVCLDTLAPPQAVEVPRKTAGGADDDIVSLDEVVHRPEGSRLNNPFR